MRPRMPSQSLRLRPKQRLRRHTPAFQRQGEWFFVPALNVAPPKNLILRDEPLGRGRGKAHRMQYAYRTGGATLYFSRKYPRGLKQVQFEALDEEERRPPSWGQMIRDAEVFAMARIAHPDHATLVLRGWHRVLMNTECGARAMRPVAFLDQSGVTQPGTSAGLISR